MSDRMVDVADWDAVKGLVLAGGVGSRLRPFTYTGAKQLVPVANKPVLFYGLEQLVEAGITDIGIVVGATAEEIQAAVGDGSRFGARVTYLHQPQPLGLAHAIAISRAWLGASPFVMVLGDNFLRGGLKQIVARFRDTRPAAQIHLVDVADPSDLGVAILDAGGRLQRMVEKPREFVSGLAIIGIYCFTPAVHRIVAGQQPSTRGELEITDSIQGLVESGETVDALPLEDCWIDTGKMADILEANRAALEMISPRVDGYVDAKSHISGRVLIEQGARIMGSVIEGPAVVGCETLIQDSHLGPGTSIYHHCRIVGAEIADSVVLERTEITGLPARIEASLIGRDVCLHGGRQESRAYRLVLGDHSAADIP